VALEDGDYWLRELRLRLSFLCGDIFSATMIVC